MRTVIDFMAEWTFHKESEMPARVTLPHTWNAIDGSNGGNDYYRGQGTYEKDFDTPLYDSEKECVWIFFEGVGMSADVFLNENKIISHQGGYQTFGVDISTYLKKGQNHIIVKADNSVNDEIYPQKADFTFFGGIYRPVRLVIMNRNHFDGGKHCGTGIRVTSKVMKQDASVLVETSVKGAGDVEIEILDASGEKVSFSEAGVVLPKDENVCHSSTHMIPSVHLWNGVKDPYLYTVKASLKVNGEVVDEVSSKFGVREFAVDAERGFILNGSEYPLRGVSRHQDYKGMGSAITNKEHEEDIALIMEMGATAVRLAHYQHAQRFYDLCDEKGLIVWAEIPYISEHLKHGNDNTESQMRELIIQNFNHPSIICWGISNEITISSKNKKAMMENHRRLNDLCHKLDATRLTTLACYSICSPFNKVAHKVSDLVGWNLYLGWYVPGFWLNDLWFAFFRLCYPKRRISLSEYGAEGMPNLHSATPKRGDHSEEYQTMYHEYMVKFIERHRWLWGTFLWNLFDFAADARDQGGEPGMNHKGLITYDRKIKKDSFFLYKAYWSEEPFVHICSKRFRNRTGDMIHLKVYSNLKKVEIFSGEERIAEKVGDKIFEFDIPLKEELNITAKAEDQKDQATFVKVSRTNPSYVLKRTASKDWV